MESVFCRFEYIWEWQGKPEVEAALSKLGRYTKIKEDLYAKKVVMNRRFMVLSSENM